MQLLSSRDWNPDLSDFKVKLFPFQRSPDFLAPGASFMEDNFSTDRGGGGGWFWDDSNALHLLCTLFLLLLHQFHPRSLVIRSGGGGLLLYTILPYALAVRS